MEGGEPVYIPSSDTMALFRHYLPDIGEAGVVERAKLARERAMAEYPYRCITEYRFMSPRIHSHPLYLCETEKEAADPNAGRTPRRVLDVGCCMGTDMRHMLFTRFVDTTRGDSLRGVDIKGEFFRVGEQLYADPSISMACEELDVLDEERCFAALGEGSFEVIYCGSVFHLLEREQTVLMARHLLRLLAPGGVLFGRTVGQSTGEPSDAITSKGDQLRYLHTPTSFKALLSGEGFERVSVDVEEIDMPKPVKKVIGGGTKAMFHFAGYKPTRL